MGCLLGAKIAERLHKKVGDRLVLRSTIWTQKNGSSIWEFNVRAIYTTDSPTFDQTMMLFHFKRFDEARQFGQGSVGYLLPRYRRSGPLRGDRRRLSMPASRTAPTKREP